MKFIPNYRVCYGGKFYEAGHQFQIKDADADEMKKHGVVLDETTPPPATHQRPARGRRANNGQSGKAETADRRG